MPAFGQHPKQPPVECGGAHGFRGWHTAGGSDVVPAARPHRRVTLWLPCPGHGVPVPGGGGGLGCPGSRPHPDAWARGLCPYPRMATGPGDSRFSGLKADWNVDRPRSPRWCTQEGDAKLTGHQTSPPLYFPLPLGLEPQSPWTCTIWCISRCVWGACGKQGVARNAFAGSVGLITQNALCQ